jgi:hypothetical protein
MRVRRLLVLLALLLSPLVPRAEAQRTWPQDSGGNPAPPCVVYDSVGNAINFCSPLHPLPVTIPTPLPVTIPTPVPVTIPTPVPVTLPTPPAGSTAFGGGFFTGLDRGVNISNFSTGDFLFLDELTVVGVGMGVSNVAVNVYRSVDGGVTFSIATVAPTGAAVIAVRNVVLTTNGLYVVGIAAVGAGVAVSRDLGVFQGQTGNGLPASASQQNTAVYKAVNTLLLTEDKNNSVCRSTAPASGLTLPAWVCAVPPTWTGASNSSSENAFNLAPSTGAGAPGGVWIGMDKASPAHIVRSTNDGTTFSALTTLALGTAGGASQLDRSVTCLRNTPATCLIGLQGNIYRSTDSGATWTLVASLTFSDLGKGLLDYGNGILVMVGSPFGSGTVPPGCPPTCANVPASVGLTLWARSNDAGATWFPSGGGWSTTSGSGEVQLRQVTTSPTSGRALLSWLTSSTAPGATVVGYLYGPTIPPGGVTVVGANGVASALLDHGEGVFAGPVQAGKLLNSQTTGAGTTAVTVTLTGVSGFRVHVYSLEARCNTAAATTTGVSMTDAATTVWSTGPSDVPAASVNYGRPWVPGYTAGDGASVVITLAACSAGTGTLIVQADQF